MELHQNEVSVGLLILAGIIPLTLGALLMPALVQLDRNNRLSAAPNSRSSHNCIIPTSGGIGIFLSVIAGLLPALSILQTEELSYVFGSLVILFMVGVKDDVLDSSPYFKLAAQVTVALLIAWGAGLKIDNLYGLFGLVELSWPAGLVLTVLFIVVVINSINFIDGIDGMAALTGISGLGAFALLFYLANESAYCLLAIASAGALAAFLRFNFSGKNKIFMGDTGSLFIGLLLSIFILKYFSLHGVAAPTLAERSPLWIVSIVVLPVFDFFRVFFVRLSNGKSPLRADRNHIHHIIVDHCSMSHKKAAVWLNIVSGVITACIFYTSLHLETNLLFLTFLLIFTAYSFTLHYIQRASLQKAIIAEKSLIVKKGSGPLTQPTQMLH